MFSFLSTCFTSCHRKNPKPSDVLDERSSTRRMSRTSVVPIVPTDAPRPQRPVSQNCPNCHPCLSCRAGTTPNTSLDPIDLIARRTPPPPYTSLINCDENEINQQFPPHPNSVEVREGPGCRECMEEAGSSNGHQDQQRTLVSDGHLSQERTMVTDGQESQERTLVSEHQRTLVNSDGHQGRQRTLVSDQYRTLVSNGHGYQERTVISEQPRTLVTGCPQGQLVSNSQEGTLVRNGHQDQQRTLVSDGNLSQERTLVSDDAIRMAINDQQSPTGIEVTTGQDTPYNESDPDRGTGVSTAPHSPCEPPLECLVDTSPRPVRPLSTSGNSNDYVIDRISTACFSPPPAYEEVMNVCQETAVSSFPPSYEYTGLNEVTTTA